MDIRRAENTDIVALIELFRTSVKVQGAEHYSPEQVEAWADAATPESFDRLILHATTFVAVDEADAGSDPMGFCGYMPDGHISSLYVRPDCAGKGVGSALLTHVLGDARANGITSFHTRASKMAMPLFEKFGFVHGETEDYMLGNVLFRRPIMRLEEGAP